MALDGGDCAVDVRDGLALGDSADENFAGLGEGDDGGRGAHTFRVRDDGGFAAFKDGDCRVRGAEVNADCSCHGVSFLPVGASVPTKGF